MRATVPLAADEAKPWQGGASFSRANRFYRLAWQCAWLVLAAWTPPPLHGWRRMLLRLFGARIAPSAKVYGSARIWSPANLQMDAFSAVGARVIVYSMAPIRIGDHAVVSQGAHLCAGTHAIEDPEFQLVVRPIAIGSYAWIAADAFVGPGVTVGNGAVLGAKSCAMRNLDAWTVYSGNPAQAVRARRIRFDALSSPATTDPVRP